MKLNKVFIKGIILTGVSILLLACVNEKVVNLIPEESSNNPPYWCTW